MSPHDFQSFVDVLLQLWPKLDVNPEQMNVWRMALGRYEAAECIAAARDWKATQSKYPSPAAIRNRVRASRPVKAVAKPGEWDWHRERTGRAVTDAEAALEYAREMFERASELYGPEPRSTRLLFEQWQRVIADQGGEVREWETSGKDEANDIHKRQTQGA